MVNIFLRDIIICNLVGILLSGVLYLVGWSPINALSISFLIICALLFIWGGALGFFLSSASFDFLSRILGRRNKEESEEIRRPTPERKSKEELKKEQINLGKRMIVAGALVLGELLIITLVYVFF